jgi:hypothetical protein
MRERAGSERTASETERIYSPATLDRDNGNLTPQDRKTSWRGGG